MTEIENQMMEASVLPIDKLINAKVTQKQREIARCDEITKLMQKFAVVDMTPEERKIFSLSFTGPNQRKLGKALASLRFWEDPTQVKAWLEIKNKESNQ